MLGQAGSCTVDPSVESTCLAAQKFRTDNQFLDSANGISVFLEEKAMGSDNKLQQAKALAVNKIGHAMHDLDPVFREFSRCVLSFGVASCRHHVD